jgi:hypothetical protein
MTLRQEAISLKLPRLAYIDVAVFSRVNLVVRKRKKLVPISNGAEFSAAWSAYNVELQKYSIGAQRSADALMVTKYYAQLVRMLTENSSQWKLISDMDAYIRGHKNPAAVAGRVEWSVENNDDTYVSQFRHDISLNHREASRVTTSSISQRAPTQSARRHSTGSVTATGTAAVTVSNKRNVCYAYNGRDPTTLLWGVTNYCRGAERCKFAHKCFYCKADGHAVYEKPECSQHPRDVPTNAPASRRA